MTVLEKEENRRGVEVCVLGLLVRDDDGSAAPFIGVPEILIAILLGFFFWRNCGEDAIEFKSIPHGYRSRDIGCLCVHANA
jgi:hypothetical protein